MQFNRAVLGFDGSRFSNAVSDIKSRLEVDQCKFLTALAIEALLASSNAFIEKTMLYQLKPFRSFPRSNTVNCQDPRSPQARCGAKQSPSEIQRVSSTSTRSLSRQGYRGAVHPSSPRINTIWWYLARFVSGQKFGAGLCMTRSPSYRALCSRRR